MIQSDPLALEGNAFARIGKQWMLITAQDGDKINTMTASWGGFGEMWNRRCVSVVIRPQRYTRHFVEKSGLFSLCFLPETYRAAYKLLGSKSGREGDKIRESGLTVVQTDKLPAFAESELTLCCRVLYKQDLEEDCFMDKSLSEQFYPAKDLHRLYIAEILSAWTR